MSFILDALRKSETERQRQTTPSLADAQYQLKQKQRSVWIPVLVAILAVNLVIVGYVFLGNSRDISDKPPVTGQRAPSFVERRRVTPAEITVEESVRKPLASELVNPATTVELAAEPSPAAVTGNLPASGERRTSAPEIQSEPANLPTMQQLLLSGQLSLSPLHIDIHVYAGQSEKRFIFINMNKYQEGEILEEGPRVEEITNTGVILSHQGNRFTLDRE